MSAQFFVQIQALRQVTERQAAEIAELRGQVAKQTAVIDNLAREVTMLLSKVDPAGFEKMANDNLPLGLRRAKNGYKRT